MPSTAPKSYSPGKIRPLLMRWMVGLRRKTPLDQPSPKTRDARGRLLPGHCPNRNGRPKKKRFKNYDPSDPRHFFSTLIEVATADGPQVMDRRTALLNKIFEGAMKGKATPMRMLMAMIKETDQQLAELRLHYDRMECALIHDNPNFKSLNESLTVQQKIKLLTTAATLNHYHPGQYDAILGKAEGDFEGWSENSADCSKKSGR